MAEHRSAKSSLKPLNNVHVQHFQYTSRTIAITEPLLILKKKKLKLTFLFFFVMSEGMVYFGQTESGSSDTGSWGEEEERTLLCPSSPSSFCKEVRSTGADTREHPPTLFIPSPAQRHRQWLEETHSHAALALARRRWGVEGVGRGVPSRENPLHKSPTPLPPPDPNQSPLLRW